MLLIAVACCFLSNFIVYSSKKNRKVSSSDFQRLCKAIRHNTSLKELHSGHALTKEDIRALADALSENQGLQSLSIGDKSFGNEGTINFLLIYWCHVP